jgi:nitronate monooxygenase
MGVAQKVQPAADIAPFGDAMCTVVEDTRPQVVSFHFGLPDAVYLDRIKAAGCRIMSSATTVEEALWLEARGVDVVIAQGSEAGGHRATFLGADPTGAIARQPSTMALVPQVVDAVKVPVVTAGGIADGRGIVAAGGGWRVPETTSVILRNPTEGGRLTTGEPSPQEMIRAEQSEHSPLANNRR